jgi:hypothetical protein
MSLIKSIARLLLFAGLVLVGRTAIAGPLHCAYGNQDSTCVPTISAGWQAAPTCSSAPGWTTVAGATWIGSQYTAPQCNYQAAPTCPTGYNETSAPYWNGYQWVGIGCSLPPASPQDPGTQCTAAIPAGFTYGSQAGFNPGSWDNPSFANGGYVFGGIPRSDTVYAAALYGPPYANGSCGTTSVNYIAYCGINPSGWFDQMVEVTEAGSGGSCNH